jgi:choline dehydrogenase-like flavoprotein
VVSSDPLAAPEIDPGFHTHPADAHVLAAGVRFADRVFKSVQLEGKVGKRVDPPPEVDLDDENAARQFVRDRIVSYHHALGTCAMGQVVDERLRVKGVRGLRIVDASVLPMQVSAAIMPTVYAAAEKGADLIKEDYSIRT